MRLIIHFLCYFVSLVSAFAAEPAINMRVTMYADGRSCPGGCDAHVVLHATRNGTRNAFHGDISARANPERCHSGEYCTVCLGEADNTCMSARYRGHGPHRDALDFTPAFFEENCNKANLPERFLAKCRSLSKTVTRLRDEHLNCFVEHDDIRCRSVMTRALLTKEADFPFYNECKRLGESGFNRRYADRSEMQRRHDCAYSNSIRRTNSSGRSWVILMPAACREGTFVGRDGLDCCSSSVYAAAGLGSECSEFFPRRQQRRL
jgi:hypothetical protein